ncbi:MULTISPECIES: HD family phosphohydrolase [Clostridium]|uniref:Membrane protein containing HD superfamily hydrolase domain n=1 Tax=Clostridium novyi (strain NT) TaxID=386415 RepID=A0Q1Q4_CLONN|nr:MULTISPECIES: HD family phosphohydrolase [Clostridium]ABK60772.1 Membrane protein containing HD superfamily hydrolase domain [Clostridium novyi NT]KEH85238.1 phosphohydrolase [Clostridium novyi A str. 4540]KEH87985.1 phosphohydrolase [Clostridium novyi A str. NCTC 538]KEH91018.1 phosphohydrolase [Clostridium novyi A str. BKT29909]KEH92336.1 phosphohydrolase [Clostridium botulinum C/D str. It1]
MNINMESNNSKRILTFVCTVFFISIVLITSLVTRKYDLKEGDISKMDIKAPKEVTDTLKTKEKQVQQEETVPLQYNKNLEIKKETLQEINNLFFQINKYVETANGSQEKLGQIKIDTKINLSDEELKALTTLNKDKLKLLQEKLVGIMTKVLDLDIREDNEEDIKKAQDAVAVKFNSSKLSRSLRDLGIRIGTIVIKPNFFYDEAKTNELKTEARKAVQPIIIKKGQTIVKEGEPITQRDIILLKDLGLLDNNTNIYVYLIVFALVAFVMFLQWFYICRYFKELYDDYKKLILLSILTCISVVFARTLSIISPFLIPLACVPMLFALLINYKVAITYNVINCILISAVVQFNIEITLLAILNSILGAIALKKLQQRNDILYASIFIGAMNVVLTLTVGFLLSNNVLEVLRKAGFSFIGSITSAILTVGFLPFFESTFDIVTTIKLLEISNPNHPAQKRLLLEAPGTYHHSVLVANLAEVAAEQVGGNPVLARVSAYYHDIGKIKRPMFFKENQIGPDNPHDKINPNLSTLIITSHVKDGVEMAKEYKLPQVIRDAIQQHHGTSLVKYFYITAKNNSEKPEEIKEEDFRYQGPIPESKEIAILMLADSVEAAVRSIKEPTKGKIEEMVNNIIKARLNEGQLDNCDLTLKDLEKIRKSFLKTLSGIYHQRIEYPTEK